jgi:hypothetical protein
VRLLEEVTVLVFESAAIAERFGAMPECEDMIAERLGERAFAVYTECKARIEEVFAELKIHVDHEHV